MQPARMPALRRHPPLSRATRCAELRIRAATTPSRVGAMNIAVAVRLMPKAGDELELDASGTDIDREYRRHGDHRLRRPGARGGRPHQGGHRRDGHRGGSAGGRRSSRRSASPTRAGPTEWSSSTRATSTRTTRGTPRSPSRRRSAQLAPDLVLVGRADPVRPVRADGAGARGLARLAAGQRRRRRHRRRRHRTRRSRSTPAAGWRCWRSRCPPSSACSPPARRRATCRWRRLRQAMTEASPETLSRQRRATARGAALVVAGTARAEGRRDDARRRCRGDRREDRRASCVNRGALVS